MLDDADRETCDSFFDTLKRADLGEWKLGEVRKDDPGYTAVFFTLHASVVVKVEHQESLTSGGTSKGVLLRKGEWSKETEDHLREMANAIVDRVCNCEAVTLTMVNEALAAQLAKLHGANDAR